MKKFSGLGLLGLLIVVLIVLWLVAQNGRTAIEAARQTEAESDGGGEYGALPGLGDMQKATGGHADALADALEKTNEP